MAINKATYLNVQVDWIYCTVQSSILKSQHQNLNIATW